MYDEQETVDPVEESLPSEDQDLNVREDEETQDPQEGEESEEDLQPEEKPMPFHEHPRFQALINENRETKALLREMKEAQEQERKLQNMTPDEKKVHDLKKQFGFATMDDVRAVQIENARLQEQLRFEKFVAQYPDASQKADLVRQLALLPGYRQKSYEEIWKELGGIQPQKKVVARRVKTGIKPTSSASKMGGGEKLFTREQVRTMSLEEYKKNEKQILKQMREGKLS